MKRLLTGACAMAWILTGRAEATVTGETTRPTDGCYVLGEQAEAVFSGTGFPAQGDVELAVTVKDAYGKTLSESPEKAKADAAGGWKRTVALPSDRYGAFRVYVTADGVSLPVSGTRGAGYLTYAVLADPKKRPLHAAEDAFLGIHGSTPSQPKWLGARWQLNDNVSDRWPNGEPESFAARKRLLEREGWASYFFITAVRIFQRPKFYSDEARRFFGGKGLPRIPQQIVTEKGRQYCAEALANLAKAAVGPENMGQKHRVYEIFWEPELFYKNAADMMTLAKIAYPAIHANDPEAIVAAPTSYTMSSVDWLRDYLERGMGDYMDAVSIHPYGHVEGDDFRGKIRAMKSLVRRYKGRDLPFYGTESNYGADVTPASELNQAETWVRTLLTLLGEGFRFHHVFYGYDFGSDSGKQKLGGCGLAYNLDYPDHRWSPVRLSPKPSFAAVSAFATAVDGCRPTCVIDDFEGTQTGYAYSDKSEARCVVALWDCGGVSEVSFESGRETTRVMDLMGNERTLPSPNGQVRLALSPSATYVLDADPAIWGRNGRRAKELRAKVRETVETLKVAGVVPHVAAGRAGVSVTVANAGDKPVTATVESRIRGIPEARVEREVRLAANGEATVVLPFEDRVLEPLQMYRTEVFVRSGTSRADWVGAVNFLAAGNGCLGPEVRSGDTAIACGWNDQGAFMRIRSHQSFVEVKFARRALDQRTPNVYADQINEAVQRIRFGDGTATRVSTFSVAHKEGPVAVVACKTLARDDGTTEQRFLIPWSELGFKDPPKAGDSFRLSLPEVFPSQDDNPKSFGIVTLGADGGASARCGARRRPGA